MTKKTHKPTATPRPPAPGASIEAALIGGVFNSIIGKVIPDYAAMRDVPPDVIAQAGLRNGMTPEHVSAAIYQVVERNKGG